MNRRVPLMALSLLLFAGCHVDDQTTKAVSSAESGRAGSASSIGNSEPAVDLPFENPFPDRWNQFNDGTTYEPCVAFSDQELIQFDIDPALIEDAALVNGQGSRGCNWLMRDTFGFGQVVTNSPSLVAYRRDTPEVKWMPDFSIEGRVVGLFGLNDDPSTCSSYVQSKSAGVVTNVSISSAPEARGSLDACGIVQDFTRAYIDKIPE